MSFLRAKCGLRYAQRGLPYYIDGVTLRGLCVFLFLAACTAGDGGPHGASRIAVDLGSAEAAPREALREAASEAMLEVGDKAGETGWRARLAGDGTAHRLDDNRPGRWRVDDAGRLCTSFDDGTRGCWRVARDGASDPSLRGPGGQRARLEPGEQRKL